jgi:hypothetical protein
MSKGQAELLVYIFRVILIAILAFLLAVQIGFFTNIQTPTNDLEAELITQRILFGPSGLAVKEAGTGTVVPGTIDLAKMNTAYLTAIYKEGFDEKFWGGKVALYRTRQDLTNEQNAFPGPLYLDENSDATKLLPLAKAGVRGSGSGIYYSSIYPVHFRRAGPDAKDELGWVKVELVKRT